MTIMRSLLKPFISFKNWYLKASWKKKIVTAAIFLIVLFFLTSPLRAKGPQYTTEQVRRDTVTDVVSESGNVTSSGRFDVYSPSTGYVEEVYVQNEDMANQGQNLFKVKSTASPQEKASAFADYTNALSTLNTAKAKINSLQSALFIANQKFMNDRGIINPSVDQQADPVYIEENANWLQAEADYKNQTGAITAAQAALTKTSLAYQATQDIVVTAPASGTIANFSASVGDKVTAASAVSGTISSGAPVLAILSDLSKTAIRIQLNEVDVDKVKIDQPATITFDAFREKRYKGHVATIDAAGTNTNGVITYNATIVIDNPDTNIKTEMTATISIETAKHENVLTVPNSAVKPYKGGKAVIVTGISKDSQVENKAGQKLPFHYVPVKIGLKGITETEIIEGVTDKTQVVTSSIN